MLSLLSSRPGYLLQVSGFVMTPVLSVSVLGELASRQQPPVEQPVAGGRTPQASAGRLSRINHVHRKVELPTHHLDDTREVGVAGDDECRSAIPLGGVPS